MAYVILEHDTDLNDLVFDLEHEHENLFLEKCFLCPPQYWLDLVEADLFSETRVELYFEACLYDEELLEKLNRVVANDEKDISISYGVYPTDLEIGFSFALKSSSDIQQQE